MRSLASKCLQLLILGAVLMGPSSAWAGVGRVVQTPDQTQKIPGLAWQSRSFVLVKDASGVEQLALSLEGIYHAPPGWALLWLDKGQRLPSEQVFTLTVPLVSDVTRVSIIAIGLKGEQISEKIFFRFPRSSWAAAMNALRGDSIEEGGPPKAYFLTAGLGPTFTTYHEDPFNLNVMQFGLTGKVTGGYRIIPNKLDIAANTFGTLVSAATIPSTTPFARFYGINARIGYVLPVKWWGADWTLLAGWYFWGMLVGDNSYGIASLNGPQLFFSMRLARPGRRTLSGYLKYAPLSDGAPTFNLSTFELATGASFQLSRPGKPRPIALTCDVSYTVARDESAGNSLSLLSASLGVQFAF